MVLIPDLAGTPDVSLETRMFSSTINTILQRGTRLRARHLRIIHFSGYRT